MYNKKAISDVISTVLIILLVVAAIAIIGAIVLNTVNKGATGVNSAVSCQSLDIKPTRCSLAGVASTFAVAQRGASGSDIQVNSVTFLFTKSDGTTTQLSTSSSINAVGSTVTGNQSGAFTSVATFENVTLSDGSNTVCPASTPVSCS